MFLGCGSGYELYGYCRIMYGELPGATIGVRFVMIVSREIWIV